MVATINADTTNGVVITSDTSGEIELQANGVTQAKVTSNGLQDANGASLRGGNFRNILINGDMKIAQRNTSVSGITSNGYYTVDRFKADVNLGTWTASQDTDVPTGQGFSNSFKYDCTASASPSAASNFYFVTALEGQNLQHLKWGTSSAESLTLSFWIKSNKTGTYPIEFYQTNGAKHIVPTYTISAANTWEKKIITIDGNTANTILNNNASGLLLFWWLDGGSDYTSGTSPSSWSTFTNANRAAALTVNLADSTSNYINITGVQLEVGSGASDFEFLPYDVQLARCMRYYFDTGSTVNGAGGFNGAMIWKSFNASEIAANNTFPVPMRTAPTITSINIAGNAGVHRFGSGDVNVTISWNNVTNIGIILGVATSAFTTTEPNIYGARIKADAEL